MQTTGYPDRAPFPGLPPPEEWINKSQGLGQLLHHLLHLHHLQPQQKTSPDVAKGGRPPCPIPRQGRPPPRTGVSPPSPGATAPSPTAAGNRGRECGWSSGPPAPSRPSPCTPRKVQGPPETGSHCSALGADPPPPSSRRVARGTGSPVEGVDTSLRVPSTPGDPGPLLPGYRSESPLSLARTHGASSPGGAGSSLGGGTGSGTGSGTGNGQLGCRPVLRAPLCRRLLPGRGPRVAPPTGGGGRDRLLPPPHRGPDGNLGHPWMGRVCVCVSPPRWAPPVPGHPWMGVPRQASSSGYAGQGSLDRHPWVSISGSAPLEQHPWMSTLG